MLSLKVWGGIKWVLMRMSKTKKGVKGGLVRALFLFFSAGSTKKTTSCQSQQQEVRFSDQQFISPRNSTNSKKRKLQNPCHAACIGCL